MCVDGEWVDVRSRRLTRIAFPEDNVDYRSGRGDEDAPADPISHGRCQASQRTA